jgi:hypothetical protein
MSSEENNKPTKLHVTVDSEQMKNLIQQNERLEREKAEMQTQIAESEESRKLLDDMKEKASLELTNLGVPTEPTDIKDKESLDRAVATIQKLREKQQPKIGTNPSGSAPLQNFQNPNFAPKQQEGFSDYPSMIDSVRDLASHSNPDPKSRAENQKILETLMAKAIHGQKQNPIPFNYSPKPEDKGTLQTLKEQFAKRKQLSRGVES